MILPDLFIKRMQHQLGNEFPAFISAMQSDIPVSIRINPQKYHATLQEEPVPWSREGYYLKERPLFTLDPLFHAGVYYVQEAGSMFVGEVVRQLFKDTPLVGLDLCAAPGGKTTHVLSSLPQGSLLVSNEVIKTRVSVLKENVQKWGSPDVVITNSDPKQIGKLTGFFDFILVDAPCSGEGMFRKDPVAVSEWSEEAVKFCAERQRRILADVWDALKPGGILIYSTCTYNREENEDNVCWIESALGAKTISLMVDEKWNVISGEKGYRFLPHRTRSEGFFLSVLKKDDGEEKGAVRLKRKPDVENKKWKNIDVINWIKQPEQYQFIVENNYVRAFPNAYINQLEILKQHVYLSHAGVLIGEIKGKDIIPDISLGLSNVLNTHAFHQENLTWREAIRYLQKENLYFPEAPKGWLLVNYKGYPLGFVKNIGNRSNSNYPQEWRIKMRIDNGVEPVVVLK